MGRKALAQVVALVLLAQLATLGSAAAAVWRAPLETAGDCRCVHGDAALVCPMHKGHARDTHCSLRSTRPDDAAVLASLFATLGVMPASATLPAPDAALGVNPCAVVSVRSLFPPPDAPPPRG
jgi:hypothetical protein